MSLIVFNFRKVLPKFKTIALLALTFCKNVKPGFVKDIKSLHKGKSPFTLDNDRSFIGANAADTADSADSTVQNFVKLCIEKYK